MNTLTWYAKGGVETPVVTCERHRLTEYNVRKSYGFEIAGSNRNTVDACDVCEREGLLTNAQTLVANALRALRPECIPGTDVILSDSARGSYYRAVSAVMAAAGVETPTLIAKFCDLAGVPS